MCVCVCVCELPATVVSVHAEPVLAVCIQQSLVKHCCDGSPAALTHCPVHSQHHRVSVCVRVCVCVCVSVCSSADRDVLHRHERRLF